MPERLKMVDRLLAEAAMCEEAASLCRNQEMAVEYKKLANECRQAVSEILKEISAQ